MTLIERVRGQLAHLELDCPVLWEPVRPAGSTPGAPATAPLHDVHAASRRDVDSVAQPSNN